MKNRLLHQSCCSAFQIIYGPVPAVSDSSNVLNKGVLLLHALWSTRLK